MSNIAKRQTVIVSTNLALAGGNNFSQSFDLRFSPDQVILRQLSYASDADTRTGLANVYTNMTEDLYLCSFPVIDNTVGPLTTSVLTNFDMHYDLYRNFQNKTFNFQVQARTGGLIDDTVQGLLSITLEFVRYK